MSTSSRARLDSSPSSSTPGTTPMNRGCRRSGDTAAERQGEWKVSATGATAGVQPVEGGGEGASVDLVLARRAEGCGASRPCPSARLLLRLPQLLLPVLLLPCSSRWCASSRTAFAPPLCLSRTAVRLGVDGHLQWVAGGARLGHGAEDGSEDEEEGGEDDDEEGRGEEGDGSEQDRRGGLSDGQQQPHAQRSAGQRQQKKEREQLWDEQVTQQLQLRGVMRRASGRESRGEAERSRAREEAPLRGEEGEEKGRSRLPIACTGRSRLPAALGCSLSPRLALFPPTSPRLPWLDQ